MVHRDTFQYDVCKTDGIKPFYPPLSNPEGLAIYYHCLDIEAAEVIMLDLDAQSWEASAASMAHNSRE